MSEYLEWIIGKITSPDQPHPSDYYILLRELFNREFYSLLPMDRNREADGQQLRWTYLEECGKKLINIDEKMLPVGPCRILEMMVGLAMRASSFIQTKNDDKTSYLFWIMIKNLGLEGCTDEKIGRSEKSYAKMDNILQNFLDRKYTKRGKGGLFPVKSGEKDQRKVEIWYQMMAFLNENEV